MAGRPRADYSLVTLWPARPERPSPPLAGGPAVALQARRLGTDRFWFSYIRIGFFIAMLEAAATLAYVELSPHAPHRPWLFAIVAGFWVTVVGGFGSAGHVARQRWRGAFALGFVLCAMTAAALFASLDGGLDSPAAPLVLLPVVFASLALSPKATGLTAGAGLVEAFILFGTSRRSSDPALIMALVLVTSMGILSVAYATFRLRQVREEDIAFSELERLSRIDSLTQCANHSTFQERLSDEVDRALRNGTPLSLLVLDVDLFKSFNDAHGHAEGDAALVEVGAALRSVTRGTDLPCRIGGDEFAVLMPETTGEEARATGARIVEALESGPVAGLSASIGAAELDLSAPTPTQLFRDADSALYYVKVTGRHDVALKGSIDVRRLQERRFDYAEYKRLSQTVRDTQRRADEALTILETLQSSAPVGFLFVDRDLRFVRVNQAVADINGVPVEEHLGRKVADVVPWLWEEIGPLYRRVLEGDEPVVNVEVATPRDEHRKACPQRWLLESFYPVRLHGETIGVGVVIVDITDRKLLEQSSEQLTYAVATALASAGEMRDRYTAGHQRRVAVLSAEIARHLGLNEHEVRGIELAASIHDIGKVALPSELLLKPGDLDEHEVAMLRSHVAYGYRILAGIAFPWPVADMVGQHHERMDGSGYPAGLKGDEILLGARIIAAADVVDEMGTPRQYRAARGLEAAIEEIRSGRGVLYDPDVVDAFLELVETNHPVVASAIRDELVPGAWDAQNQVGKRPKEADA